MAAALAEGRIDWITVTSSAIARALAAMFGKDLQRSKLASISPITSGVLRELGYPPAAEARQYTMPGLVEAIVGGRGGGAAVRIDASRMCCSRFADALCDRRKRGVAIVPVVAPGLPLFLLALLPRTQCGRFTSYRSHGREFPVQTACAVGIRHCPSYGNGTAATLQTSR